MLVFTGRPVLAGAVRGHALVSRQGFNILASFKKSVGVSPWKAVCSDHDNPDLYGKALSGAILCLPQAIGSTTGSLVLERMAQRGLAPRALLFSRRIDSVAAAGVILTDVWIGKRIVTVDQLGPDFLEAVREGQRIAIQRNGTVTLM